MIFGFRPIFGMILGFVFALSLVLSVCRIAICHAWKPDLGHEIGHESVRFACRFTVLLQSPSRCGGNSSSEREPLKGTTEDPWKAPREAAERRGQSAEIHENSRNLLEVSGKQVGQSRTQSYANIIPTVVKLPNSLCALCCSSFCIPWQDACCLTICCV